jgi:hypothetical protein
MKEDYLIGIDEMNKTGKKINKEEKEYFGEILR